MLWLALHIPHLPLEVFTRSIPHPAPAVAATDEGRPAVLAANRAAQGRGVLSGMDLSAACALVPELAVWPRQRQREEAALKSLAAWGMGFTSKVSLAPPDGLLLEVGGSLTLFGGIDKLRRRVLRGVARLGYQSVVAGIAPTPLGATLLARAGDPAPVLCLEALPHRMAALPAAVLDLPPDRMRQLAGVGVKTLGDLMALPRNGVGKRFGTDTMLQLDRATGKVPEPRETYVPPSRFKGRLSLPAATVEREALLFAIQRLVDELCGFLTARCAGIEELTLHLVHGPGAETPVPLSLTSPTRDRIRLRNLLRERLERVELAHEVVEIGLLAGQPVSLPGRSGDLFGGGMADAEDATTFLDRLRARLGERVVQGVAPVADHRPERAWRSCPPGPRKQVAPPGPRPLWLLEAPRPLAVSGGRPRLGGPLSLEAGPERIEGGWWDGEVIARDYYRVVDGGGARYWVFRDRAGGGWFLHGLFG